jgi:dynein heavy chain
MKDSWDEAGKPTLNEMNFLKKLKEFEKDSINEETIELLYPYFSQQDDWFNDASASRASKAAAGILKWAFAIYDYHDKSKIVKPKKIFLAI